MELVGDVDHVESYFGPFGDSFSVSARYVHVLCQMYRGTRIILHYLDDEGQVEARFSPFGDSANLDARWMRGLRRMYHRLRNHFGCTRWNSYVTWVMWNLVSVRLETVLVSVQDRCTVCAECTIGSEVILDTPDGTPR
jgi:hypothetical protein